MNIEKIKEHINDCLVETNFTNLGERKVGKVRDIYTEKDHITLISTDRHSSFDRIIAHVPFKGEVLNQISYVEEYMSKALRMAKTEVIDNCLRCGPKRKFVTQVIIPFLGDPKNFRYETLEMLCFFCEKTFRY